jgi:phage terminase large subunit
LSTLKIPTAKIFEPLLAASRYKGAFGGRGSGKSHFFGEFMVETCQAQRGTLAVCIREAQRTLAQSSKRLIESKIASLGVGSGFKIFNDKIETPGDGIMIFRGMQDHTAETIKSLEGFKIAWVDEAQNLSERSLSLLRPTIRAKGSELWASWNPRRRSDAIDDFLRSRNPAGAVVVNANWRDNPWFPSVLEDERKLDLSLYPDRYQHIWEGDYIRAFEGAYFAAMLNEARAQGRIGKVAADPLLPLRGFVDIGGSGATADAFTIWIVQWVGAEMRADFQHLRRWRKSRAGPKLHVQGCHYRDRGRIRRRRMARRQSYARQMIRTWLVVASLLLPPPAQALPCWIVRKAVAQYGEAAAEAWARAKGVSDKEIEKAKRCLR